MKISNNGLKIIKESEGLRLNAYDDLQPNVNLTATTKIKGTLTIGYGHTGNVKWNQKISEEKAEQLLKEDTGWAQTTVNQMVKVPLNQNQFDSLVSFVYNVGSTNFRTSTLLEYLNQKEYIKASLEFERWNKSKGKVLQGLVNRRKKEKELFLKSVKEVKKEETKKEETKKEETIQKVVNGIKSLGTVKLDGVKKFTYIYEKTSDTSSRLGQANKNDTFEIAGSVKGWWEIIYNGKRAYIKDKYASRIK